MESLKSQSRLGSVDRDGRSLGTERSSASNRQGAGTTRFTSLLDASVLQEGAVGRETLSAVEDRVAQRIRDGRTDAADQSPSRERGESVDAEPRDRGASRSAERSSEGRTRRPERGRPDKRGSGEAASGPGESRISSRERGIELTDASEAEGAAAEEVREDLPVGPALAQVPQQPVAQGVAPAGPAGAANLPVAAIIGTPIAGFGAVQGARPGGPAEPSLAAQRLDAPRAEARRAPTVAAPARSDAAQRAEAILEQVKVRIQSGDKSALVELRPAELGRLRLQIQVDGGNVRATLGAESAESLAILEAHAPELRAWLSKDGAQSVELEFTRLDASDAGLDASGRELDGRSGGRDGGSGNQRGPGQHQNADVPVGAPEALTQALARRTSEDGVDLVA